MGMPITIGDVDPVYDRITGAYNKGNNITLEVNDVKLEITVSNDNNDVGISLDATATEVLLQAVTIMLRQLYESKGDNGL